MYSTPGSAACQTTKRNFCKSYLKRDRSIGLHECSQPARQICLTLTSVVLYAGTEADSWQALRTVSPAAEQVNLFAETPGTAERRPSQSQPAEAVALVARVSEAVDVASYDAASPPVSLRSSCLHELI